MFSQAFLPSAPLVSPRHYCISAFRSQCPTRCPQVFSLRHSSQSPLTNASLYEPRVPSADLPRVKPILTHLKDSKEVKIDVNSGKCPTRSTTKTTIIQEATIQLPAGNVDTLHVYTDRPAEAVVYAPQDVLCKPDLSTTPFIIFAHGFSQLPRNYATLLRHLAAQGNIIIAPQTWIFSVLFAKIETVGFFDSLQAKLQTALLVDSARAFQLASQYSSVVHLCGHSMGGAMMMVYGGYVGSKAQSLVLMAPDVGNTRITELNQTVSLDAKDGVSRMQTLASKLDTRMLVLHGDKDRFVPRRDMLTLISALERKYLSGLCSLLRGTHIGFENSLDVDVPVFHNLDRILFAILDCIVYGSLDLLRLDTKEQLETAKALLPSFIKNIDESRESLIDAVVSSETEEKVKYMWK